MKKLGLLLALALLAMALLAGTANAAVSGLWNITETPNFLENAAEQPLPSGQGGAVYSSAYNCEEGVIFTTAEPIYIVGVAFYKGDPVDHTWTATLWDAATKVALASGQDSTTVCPGWQQVIFDTPVLMGTEDTYTASYTHLGATYGAGEAWTWNYFTSALTTPPVTAAASINGPYDFAIGTYPDGGAFGCNYWVTPLWSSQRYTKGGFYAPVDMGDTVFNTVKGGATVPLKFEVFDLAGVEQTDIAVVKSFKAIQSDGAGSTIGDAIEVTTTGATSLRYDTVAGQFVQNWKTPKASGTWWIVTVTLQDDTTISATFYLK